MLASFHLVCLRWNLVIWTLRDVVLRSAILNYMVYIKLSGGQPLLIASIATIYYRIMYKISVIFD